MLGGVTVTPVRIRIVRIVGVTVTLAGTNEEPARMVGDLNLNPAKLGWLV